MHNNISIDNIYVGDPDNFDEPYYLIGPILLDYKYPNSFKF